MTNAQIISTAAAMNGIEEEVHTFARWKSLGYGVKKGEKAAFKTMIWKAAERKSKDGAEVTQVNEDGDVHMFMKSAAFFTASQVQPIEAK